MTRQDPAIIFINRSGQGHTYSFFAAPPTVEAHPAPPGPSRRRARRRRRRSEHDSEPHPEAEPEPEPEPEPIPTPSHTPPVVNTHIWATTYVDYMDTYSTTIIDWWYGCKYLLSPRVDTVSSAPHVV